MIFLRRKNQIADLYAKCLICKHFPDPADVILIPVCDKNIVQTIRAPAQEIRFDPVCTHL